MYFFQIQGIGQLAFARPLGIGCQRQWHRLGRSWFAFTHMSILFWYDSWIVSTYLWKKIVSEVYWSWFLSSLSAQEILVLANWLVPWAVCRNFAGGRFVWQPDVVYSLIRHVMIVLFVMWWLCLCDRLVADLRGNLVGDNGERELARAVGELPKLERLELRLGGNCRSSGAGPLHHELKNAAGILRVRGKFNAF